MIKINFLPKELRKENITKDIKLNDYLIFPAIFLGIVIILNLLFAVVILYKKTRLDSGKKQWKAFSPSYKSVEEIKNKIKAADEKINFLKEIKGKTILWSEKLNILSDNLPNGVWFKSLKVESKGTFFVEGSVISTGEEEASLLNRFISNLKKDSNFFKDFRGVDIKSLNNRSIKTLEVKDFVLQFDTE